MENKENSDEWNRFIKLGEMIGDGLHNDPGGKWISKEYNKLRRILLPNKNLPFHAENKKKRNANIDAQMAKLIENKVCECGGKLKQKRSGTKVAYCELCNCRYVAKTKK